MTDTTQPIEAVELLPCPFCGCTPLGASPYEVDEDTVKWAIGCDCSQAPDDQPYAERYINVHGLSEAEAIAAWNRRGPRPSGDQPLERGQGRDEAMEWMLKAIAAAGGTVDSSDTPHNLLNLFCGDRGDGTDTFNLAHEADFLHTSHDSDFDTSTTRLTDAGRTFLAALTPSAGDQPGAASEGAGVRTGCGEQQCDGKRHLAGDVTGTFSFPCPDLAVLTQAAPADDAPRYSGREWDEVLVQIQKAFAEGLTADEILTHFSSLKAAPADPVDGVGEAQIAEAVERVLIDGGADQPYSVIAERVAAELYDECRYCGPGVRTGLPGNACENCMGTGLNNPAALAPFPSVEKLVGALERARKFIDACAVEGELTPNDASENPCEVVDAIDEALAALRPQVEQGQADQGGA